MPPTAIPALPRSTLLICCRSFIRAAYFRECLPPGRITIGAALRSAARSRAGASKALARSRPRSRENQCYKNLQPHAVRVHQRRRERSAWTAARPRGDAQSHVSQHRSATVDGGAASIICWSRFTTWGGMRSVYLPRRTCRCSKHRRIVSGIGTEHADGDRIEHSSLWVPLPMNVVLNRRRFTTARFKAELPDIWRTSNLKRWSPPV